MNEWMDGMATYCSNFGLIQVCLEDLRAAVASHFPHSSKQKAGFPLWGKPHFGTPIFSHTNKYLLFISQTFTKFPLGSVLDAGIIKA